MGWVSVGWDAGIQFKVQNVIKNTVNKTSVYNEITKWCTLLCCGVDKDKVAMHQPPIPKSQVVVAVLHAKPGGPESVNVTQVTNI